MSSWLKKINAGSIPIKEADDFITNINIIKNADSGVSSIDDALKNLNYRQVGDEIYVNDARYRDMEIKMRKGDITGALNDANVPTTITASDEALLRKTLSNEAPDLDIQYLDTKINKAKQFHQDLDVTATNGAELEGKLSEKSKEKSKSMYSKIFKVVGVGGVAAGIFAAVVLTGRVFDDLAAAANSRNGCFIAYKATNTTACKLLARSCGYSENGATSCATDVMQTTIYNIYLMVNDIINNSSSIDITNLRNLGCVWEDGATANEVLNVTENIPILSGYYSTKYPTYDSPTFEPCTLGGVTVGCVACNSSLPTNSLEFCTSETLDGNMIYKCITDTTIIEALTDIATTLGIDLFTASGDSISGSFQGNFLLAIIVILVLIAVVALVVKFIPKKAKADPTVSQVDKTQEQQPTKQKHEDNVQIR